MNTVTSFMQLWDKWL